MDIFLPLEVVDREYTGRLFLAVASASKGYNVYFGHKPEITKLAMKSQPNNVWFGRGSLNYELLNRGLKIVGQDEESGLICNQYSDFFKLRPGLKLISSMDRFYCWGHDDYTFLKAHTRKDSGNDRLKVVLSGSPRTITWGSIGKEFFKDEIDLIKSKYGNYILIISNLSHANSFLGDKIFDHLRKMDSWGDLEPIVRSAFEVESRLIKLYALAAKEISQKFNINVLIRPHPTENTATWSNIVQPLDRVFVESTGSVTPWILASQTVIHNSSTTGIESACSNIPTISVGDKAGDLYNGDLTYSNKVSLAAIGIENILDVLSQKDLLWNESQVKREHMLSKKVVGFNSFDSLDKILDNILNIRDVDTKDFCANAMNESYRKNKFNVKFKLSNLQNKWMSLKLSRGKRPRLKQTNIITDIRKMSRILGVDGDIICKSVDKNSFLIKKSRS
jgi:surface carbohydrate biosynthesis protein